MGKVGDLFQEYLKADARATKLGWRYSESNSLLAADRLKLELQEARQKRDKIADQLNRM